jgi:hypothetical protein
VNLFYFSISFNIVLAGNDSDLFIIIISNRKIGKMEKEEETNHGTTKKQKTKQNKQNLQQRRQRRQRRLLLKQN